jgi:hypothetical protein
MITVFPPIGITGKHKCSGAGTEGFCTASQDGARAAGRQIDVSCVFWVEVRTANVHENMIKACDTHTEYHVRPY